MCPPHPPSSDTIDDTLGLSAEEDADGAGRPINTARVRPRCLSVVVVVVVVVVVRGDSGGGGGGGDFAISA